MAKAKFPVVRKKWPIVRDYVRYFLVDGRRRGSGRKEYFVDKRKALARADQLSVERENEGTRALEFTTRDRAMFAECREILLPHGRTLRDAAHFLANHLKAEEISRRSPLIKDCADAYLHARRADLERRELAPRSFTEYRNLLNTFTAACGNERISDFDVEKLRTYINSFHHVTTRTRANRRLQLGVFFSFCKSKRWITSNPAAEFRIKVPKHDVTVLSVDAIEALLRRAEDEAFLRRADLERPEFVPYVSICTFAGLRPHETQQLDWRDVDLQTLSIFVRAATSKRRESRYVQIEPTLLEWLKPYAKPSGRVCGMGNFQRLWGGFLRAAGYDSKNPWPQDSLRHSYASYWLAVHQNRAQLAELMGNSVEVIRAAYRRPISKRDAEKFWLLRPDIAPSK